MLLFGWEVPLCYILVSFVLILCTALLVKRWLVFSEFKRHGIPGPSPNIIFGNLRELQKWQNNLVELQKLWTKKYGKVYGYYRGLSPRLVVSDVEILKKVLIRDIWNFTNRPDMQSSDKMLVTLCDQRWKDVRSVLTPTFSAKKLRLMAHLMNQCTGTLMELMDEKMKEGVEFDLYRHFQGLTMDVISKAALALELDCQRNQENVLLDVVRKIFRLERNPLIYTLFLLPEIRGLLSFFFRFTKGRGLTKIIIDNLRDVMKHRRENIQNKPYDILQLMLEAAEGKHMQDDKSGEKTEEEKFFSETPVKKSRSKQTLLDDEEIIWNAFVFLLAGFETTSTALGFTSYFLAKYPEIQEKMYDEVISVAADKDQLSYDDLSKMTYVEQVLSEAMRMFPPVPLFVARICKETVTIENVTIPAGSNVEAGVWIIHHDPDIWPDPEVFDPERFSPENKGKRHPLAYMPFGAGPRNCIGKRFALLEAKMCLAQLVRKYSIVPGDKWEDPIQTVIMNSTINPANGVWVRVEPRSKF